MSNICFIAEIASVMLIIFEALYILVAWSILHIIVKNSASCYESILKGLSKEATLVLSNTRELDRVPSTK